MRARPSVCHASPGAPLVLYPIACWSGLAFRWRLALSLLALAATAPIAATAGEPAFSTSFERDDPAPAQRGDDGARVRVGTGPEAPYAARAGMGYSGLAALRFEGTGGRTRLFEVDIPVQADTRLSWLVLPEIVGDDTVASTGVSLVVSSVLARR